MAAKVVFVTDPMCSWCWGMADEIDRARRAAAHEFEFDCLLGGINVDSTHAISDFARARLADVWRRVNRVTGATFGSGLPAGDFVYNSIPACIAGEAVRELTRAPPFEFVRRLQRRFFIDGLDVADDALLKREAVEMGLDAARFAQLCSDAAIIARVHDGFTIAKSYGTAALPSVLLEVGGVRRLVAGGYVDAPTLINSVRGHLERI
jgi:putative protein-disulfide isomerase